MQPTTASSWQKLLKQHQTLSDLSQLKSQNQGFKASVNNISLDFSNQLIDENTLKLLLELAKECNLEAKI